MIRIVLCFLLFPTFFTSPLIEDLNWPIGKWRTESLEDQYSEETWESIEHGGFRGSGVLVENGDTLFQERMSIVHVDDTWFFRADLEDQGPVFFSLEENSPSHWVFINAEHDYPQRIEYNLVDDLHMNATVSLMDGSMPSSWEFIKQPQIEYLIISCTRNDL